LESVTLSGFQVWPAQEMLKDNEEAAAFTIDQAFYASSTQYPSEAAVVDQPQIWRDARLTRLEVRPVSYNAVTGEITVATKMRITVDYFGANSTFEFDRVRQPINRKFQELYSSKIINFERLGYPLSTSDLDNPGTKWLLVCKEEAMPYVQPLFDFRHAQGLEAEVRYIAADFDTPEEIKAYIYSLYTTTNLEYVMLVGDAYYAGGPTAVDVPMYHWVDSYSDSWYTMMDGTGDYLADIACGRIVYDTAGQLQLQIQKTMDYLTAPEVSDWAKHSLLVAHSEQYPLKYTQCKEEIRTYPYALETPIFQQCYGGAGASNQNVIDYLNTYSSGILNYRGHGSTTAWWQWGSSGDFNATHIAQLTNIDRYFVHFDVCCDNMDFPDYNGDCFAESMMKHTAAAIAINGAIIPSYTIPNHDYDKEFYKAIYDEGINNIGYASNFANITVYQVHGSIGQSNIRTYLWLGDAAIDAWTDEMMSMAVIHPTAHFIGTTQITINTGVSNALVCAQNDEVYAAGYSDAAGNITLTFDPAPVMPGDLTITCSAHNYLTYQQTIPVLPPVGPYVVFNDVDINDAIVGNNNGQWDFGETIDLSIELLNVGVDPAIDVTATIITADPLITIYDGSEFYGTLAAGDSLTIANGFRIRSDESTPDQYTVLFTLEAVSGANTWESFFSLIVNAPNVNQAGLIILDPTGNNNGQLDPGEDTQFELTLANEGHSDAGNVMVTMTASDPDVTINGNPGSYGTLIPGGQDMVSYNVIADAGMASGVEVTFTLDIQADGGYAEIEEFDLVVGDIRNLPSGPDGYGHFAWDNNDGGESMPFDWVEIAPSQGGPGINNGPTSDDQTVQVNLPFTFTYFGQNFNNISICSNGWIAMGTETSTDYSNSGIPNADGPANMIALNWDDLHPGYGGTEICTYYDAANHYFVVEYYNISHYGTGGSQRDTFQGILYDPAYYGTSTGDGIILCQYSTTSDVSSSTFGIENAAESDGIQYGFDNSWDEHAWPVEVGRTITYTSGEAGTPEFTVQLDYVSGSPVPPAGGNVYYAIFVENIGTSAASFDGWLDVSYEGGAPTLVALRSFTGFLPGWTINRPDMFFPVPESYAPGNYSFAAHVGTYPGTVLAEDSFPFTKTGDFDGEFVPFVPDGVPNPFDRIDTGDIITALPDEYQVMGTYPNPFNPTTTISYALPEAGKLSLKVFDVSGRLVATLVDGHRDAGYHEVTFDASNLASGVYIYQLKVNDFSTNGKVILMK
ncbi:T9SS type A sorting domain-containing protein, partial [bacterium]|nr:T9SS type A sorting domain-containing protein [bacterium]